MKKFKIMLIIFSLFTVFNYTFAGKNEENKNIEIENQTNKETSSIKNSLSNREKFFLKKLTGISDKNINEFNDALKNNFTKEYFENEKEGRQLIFFKTFRSDNKEETPFRFVATANPKNKNFELEIIENPQTIMKFKKKKIQHKEEKIYKFFKELKENSYLKFTRMQKEYLTKILPLNEENLDNAIKEVIKENKTKKMKLSGKNTGSEYSFEIKLDEKYPQGFCFNVKDLKNNKTIISSIENKIPNPKVIKENKINTFIAQSIKNYSNDKNKIEYDSKKLTKKENVIKQNSKNNNQIKQKDLNKNKIEYDSKKLTNKENVTKQNSKNNNVEKLKHNLYNLNLNKSKEEKKREEDHALTKKYGDQNHDKFVKETNKALENKKNELKKIADQKKFTFKFNEVEKNLWKKIFSLDDTCFD